MDVLSFYYCCVSREIRLRREKCDISLCRDGAFTNRRLSESTVLTDQIPASKMRLDN